MTDAEAEAAERQRVGPSPAPGSGRPATPTRLGRVGVIVIIVVGLLFLSGWVALSILGSNVEVKVRYPHPEWDRHHRDGEPTGPGRLTTLG